MKPKESENLKKMRKRGRRRAKLTIGNDYIFFNDVCNIKQISQVAIDFDFAQTLYVSTK